MRLTTQGPDNSVESDASGFVWLTAMRSVVAKARIVEHSLFYHSVARAMVLPPLSLARYRAWSADLMRISVSLPF